MARLAKTGDARAIAEVHVRSWQVAYRGLFEDVFLEGLDVKQREAWWEHALSRGATIWVTERSGRIVGFSSLGPSIDAKWGEVFAIYVDPDHWGTGVGHELMEVSVRWLHEDGFKRALLWVLDGNRRARSFYERQGWVLGRPIRVENIGGTDVTEVRYEKDPLVEL